MIPLTQEQALHPCTTPAPHREGASTHRAEPGVRSTLPRTILCLLLLSIGVARAQDASDAAQRVALAQNPAGLACALRTADGRTEFHMGEVIRVTLDFTADQAGRYRLNPWINEQVPMDAFHVSPSDGVADPRAGIPAGGAFSGYIPAPLPLTGRPTSVTLTLNERLRFDRPGAYRLYVTSRRILDNTTGGGADAFAPGQAVTSNTIPLTILPPDPAWAHAQVQAALAQAGSPSTGDRTQTSPLDVLRFLNTLESAQALLSVLASDRYPRSSLSNSYAVWLGLVGYPDRKWLVSEMQRDLVAPDYTVTQSFLESLAWLTAHQQKSEDDAPFLRAYWDRAAEALPAKTPSALPMTLHSLLEKAWLDARIRDDPAVRARLPGLARRMALDFDGLPPQPQTYLLGTDWAWMRTPALLPSLRRQWAAAVVPENNDYERNDLVLSRLYDLSPKEGRALILAEAARPRPRVSAAALAVLPDRTLPALDKTLAAHLTDGGDLGTTCRLIARYATPAIFPPARAFYGDGEDQACAEKAALLAYFLRVRPRFGAEAVRLALTQRKQTGCYTSLFTDIGPLRYDAALERLAVAHLNDPDPQVVADAAEALGKYGSRQVERALWARLRRRDAAAPRERFEWRLVEALATGQNWYESQARLRQVRALCATENVRRQVDQYLGQNDPSGVHIDYDLVRSTAGWTIGAYTGTGYATFTAKMAQFARGTVFSWQDGGAGVEEERLFARAQRFARAHGTTVKRWHPRAGG